MNTGSQGENLSIPLLEPISGVILREPEWIGSRLRKGVVVCNYVTNFIRRTPNLGDFFWIVERRGWRGASRFSRAHVVLVDDNPAQKRWNDISEMFNRIRNLTPWPINRDSPIYLAASNADFVDTDSFAPNGSPKSLDVLMVARWEPFKCHDLLLDAFSVLIHRKINVRGLIVGHLAATTAQEFQKSRGYHDRIVARIREEQLPVDLPLSEGVAERPEDLTKTTIAALINRARMGVILSKVEGVNRFKMECLSCDVPVIVCSDACWTLHKHITPQTGIAVPRQAEALADAIIKLRRMQTFSPREYTLSTSGWDRSMRLLQDAIDKLDNSIGQTSAALSYYDGRNSTLIWNNFVDQLNSAVARCIEGQPGYR